MAIDKLIPQYLNSDTDQKLVKAVEMTDNLNIRVSNDDEGTAGVIKNIKGTDVVSNKTSSDAFPSGDNRVIGSVANEKNKEILFLVWNSASNHGVYRLDMTSGKYQKLYQDSVLNFKKFSYVDCDVIVNEENETLFYWTDNVNPPMKVNINKLISGGYPASLTSGTDEEKLLSLTVAKQPPLVAPAYNIVNNPSISSSRLYKKNFQFAYKYKYADGEVSALSPYSTYSVSVSQLKDGFITDSAKDFYNQINVFVKNSIADVEEILVYARREGSQSFYQIERLTNNGTSGTSTVFFTDDKLSSALSVDETNKIYDNVPQLARSLAITGNRLMFGNYVEGYENKKTDTDLNPVYYPEKTLFTIPVSLHATNDLVLNVDGSYLGTGHQEVNLSFDFSSIPSNVAAGTEIIIDVVVVADTLKVERSGLTKEYGEIAFSYTDAESGNLDDASYEVGNPNTINNTFDKVATLGLQPIILKEIFKTSTAQTKSQLISSIRNKVVSNTFYAVIDGDKDKGPFDYSTLAGVAGSRTQGVFAGYAAFKMSSGTLANNQWHTEMIFAGAEVHLKHVWAQQGNWITNNFTGSKELNVITSGTVKIGGSLGRNIFSSDSSVHVTGDLEFFKYGVAAHACIGGNLNGEKTFKADSYHEFGIVYSDNRGRTSGVNKIGQVYIDKKANRTNKGKSDINLRVKNSPPSWAKKWFPVYSGNQTYDYFLQYNAAFAVAALDSEKTQGSSLSNKIYVSLSTLEGNESSYKEQTGAKLEYKFEEGDQLRIISYQDSSKVYPIEFTFDIVDYKYLTDEENSAFLFRAGQFNNIQGWYLILEDNNHDGFSYNDVISNSSKWDSDVLVEIVREKKALEENIYYETGKVYDISGGNHIGDRASATQTGGFTVTQVLNNQGTAQSTDTYFVGDVLNLGGGVIIQITAVTPLSAATEYSFTYTATAPSLQNYGSVVINNFDEACINITNGDAYNRVRRLQKPSILSSKDVPDKFRKNAYVYGVSYVEADSVSDFFGSKFYSKGRPFAFIPEADTVRRRSSITYSDAYVIDSDRLNLSSFNLSLANWTDLDLMHGSINSLVPRGDALTVIQESKASQIPVGKNIIEFSSGNANVTASKNVLGGASYYAGDYGTANPESVVERFGVVYFVDAEAGKVIRLSSDGITPISEKGVDSFFENKFKSLVSVTEKIRVVGGFDPDNNEYLVTVEPVFNSSLTIGSDVFDVPVDADAEFTIQGINYTSSTVLWNIWGNLWNTYCGEWQHVGNGIVFVDSVFQTQSILVDSAFLGSTATIKVIVTDAAYSFSAIADLNLSTGKVTMPSTTCEGDSITLGSADTEEAGFTIAYKHKEGVWGSKYSFKPTMYVNINNELYSFFETASGIMWKHNANATRNNFYGTQYNSEIESVSNRNPSMIKVFEALAVEGGGTWSGTLTTSDQSTTIGTSDFDVREGHRYAMIPRDTLVSKGHQIYIGKVESISSDKVTFTTPVNRLPFVVGDILKTASGSSLSGTGMQISGITDRKTIQCTTGISNISVGNNVFVEHSARIDGDPMRDVFLKIKLTSSDTTAFEVHALSLSYDRSRLHNDRVN